MKSKINWETDFESAINEANIKNTTVLLFFNSPKCPSCQEMESTTFENESVIKLVKEYFIPLRVEIEKSESTVSKYNLKRAPTCLIVDGQGMVHHRVVGYYDSNDFMATMLLGLSKKYHDSGAYQQSLEYLDRLFKEFPKNEIIPEAIYMRGGTRFKNTGDRYHLRQAYEQLKNVFPGNPWEKRAYPYRIIENVDE